MSDPRSAPPSVLIVDDEHDIRELLVLTLGRMGLRTDTAATVAMAKAQLAQGSYDLCLTDMRLPDGTGLGLYIARELCVANEASLDYIPVPGGGSCFRILLPAPHALLRA